MSTPWLFLTQAVLLTSLTSSQSLGGPPDLATQHGCSEVLDVAIVGAGPAGAYSAYKLRNSGKRIEVFEYSDRIGGRTYNYRLPNTLDTILQLGAMRFIKGAHPKLEKVIQDLGLKSQVFTEGSGRLGRTRYFLRNVSLTKEEACSGDVPYSLTAEEKANQCRLWEYYFEKLTNTRVDSMSNPVLEDMMDVQVNETTKLYELTFNQAIDLVASPEGKDFMKDYSKFSGEMEKDASAVLEFQYLFEAQGGDLYTLDKGMEAVARGMLNQFIRIHKCRSVRRNLQLQSIRKPANNLYVLSLQHTITRDAETEVLNYRIPQKVCARKVILAMPVYALKQVDWPPLKEPAAQTAYNAVSNPGSSKVFMTFDSPWWLNYYNDSYAVFGDRSTTFKQMYDWKRSEFSGDYILLVSYADGDGSDYLKELQGLGESIPGSAPGIHRVSVPLKDALLDSLALALNIPQDQVPQPKTALAQFWSVYPFGSGWVTFRAGHEFSATLKKMQRPSDADDVFVVGSDYSWGLMAGWIEGGLQTVDQVMDKFFPEYI